MSIWIKKFIPAKWKEAFREYILSLIRKEQQQPFAAFENRINNLQTQVNTLNEQMAATVANLGNLQTHVNNVNDQLATTVTNLESVGHNLEVIHNSQSSRTEDILRSVTEFSSQLARTLSDLGNLQTHVNNVNNQLTTTVTNLESVGHNLGVIDRRLSSQIDDIRQSADTVRKRLEKHDLAGILFFMHLPDVLPHSDGSLSVINDFRKQFNIGFEFNTDLAKEDIMFLYSLVVLKDFNLTCHNYLKIGYSGFSIVRAIAHDLCGEHKFDGQILDFASGYGRVTRFLAGYFGPDHITTSDIKTEAVDFQKTHFKVKGFYSDYRPGLVRPKENFDIIFAGSLFSHLNETLFPEWLEQLLSFLKEGGYLLFTVHDKALYPQVSDEEFIYVHDNEDEKFEFIPNRITSTKLYGLAFVSEQYVKKVLERIAPSVRYLRYPKSFGDREDFRQDLYVATYNERLPSQDLKFN